MAQDEEKMRLEARVELLETELANEKRRSSNLERELTKLRSATAKIQLQVEEEEEFLTNKLMQKLEDVKREKEHIALQVEQEEEFLTNTLQKKLDTLKQEKIDLENQLEQEEEYIVNKLQKQLAALTNEKMDLERQLESKKLEMMDHIYEVLVNIQESIKSSGYVPENADDLANTLKDQINALKDTQHRFDQELQGYRTKNKELYHELNRMTNENFLLSQKIKRERERFYELNAEKISLVPVDHPHTTPPLSSLARTTVSPPKPRRARSNSLPSSQHVLFEAGRSPPSSDVFPTRFPSPRLGENRSPSREVGSYRLV